jgi:DNA repair photolyase
VPWFKSPRPSLVPIRAKSVLHPFIEGGLTLNPYVGCGHRCAYCYATYEWAEEFYDRVRAKMNAPELFAAELRRSGPLVPPVMLSSATDPYQPAEARLRLTRRVVEECVRAGVGFYIFTKSALVLRDLDLFSRARDRCLIVFSLITVDEALKRLLEPGAPSARALLAAARKLSSSGVRVAVNIAPVIPFLTDSEGALERLISRARAHGVLYFDAAPLRLREDIWTRLGPLLEEAGMGDVKSSLERLYFSRGLKRAHYILPPEDYRTSLTARIRKLVASHGGTFGLPIEEKGRQGARAGIITPRLLAGQATLYDFV